MLEKIDVDIKNKEKEYFDDEKASGGALKNTGINWEIMRNTEEVKWTLENKIKPDTVFLHEDFIACWEKWKSKETIHCSPFLLVLRILKNYLRSFFNQEKHER